MVYHSTRNSALAVSSAEAIAQGIASDGGWSDWVDPRGGYGEGVIGGVALYEATFGKLSDEEVEQIRKEKKIYLYIFGRSMPPVCIQTQSDIVC